jgi:hypothetical protein
VHWRNKRKQWNNLEQQAAKMMLPKPPNFKGKKLLPQTPLNSTVNNAIT